MNKIAMMVVFFTLLCTTVFAETSRKNHIMVSGGVGKFDGSNSALLPKQDIVIGDVTGVHRFNDYIGLGVIAGMMQVEHNGTVGSPVRHNEKYRYENQYLGLGVQLALPLTYVDVYTSAFATYNLNRFELKGASNSKKNSGKSGFILNAGLMYYIGNFTVGGKYQYNYTEVKAKTTTGYKNYIMPLHSGMVTVGFSF